MSTVGGKKAVLGAITWFGIPLLLALPSSLDAQALRAQLVDFDTRTPVSGAIITAIGERGEVGGRTLSDGRGGFSLDFPSDFDLATIRVQRVGYAAEVVPTSTFSSSGEVVIPVRSSPIELPRIVAEGERRCGGEVRSGGPAYDLWIEFRKTLRVVELSRSVLDLTFEVERFTRLIDPDDSERLAESTVRDSISAGKPYRTISVRQMTERGWVEELQDGGRQYYAPDATILRSDEFTDQLCFEADLVDETPVLRFVPGDGRDDLPEIEGMMTLDPVTNELEEIRFEYVSVASALSNPRAEGIVHFCRAPNGVRVVDRWLVRLPVLEVRGIGFGIARRRVRVRHIREIGGRVTGVLMEGRRSTSNVRKALHRHRPGRPVTRAVDRGGAESSGRNPGASRQQHARAVLASSESMEDVAGGHGPAPRRP